MPLKGSDGSSNGSGMDRLPGFLHCGLSDALLTLYLCSPQLSLPSALLSVRPAHRIRITDHPVEGAPCPSP
ncbi:protein of unknown function [Streptomyces sp. KY75]|nr:protein of unknown function [Streptomyces sp. KY70]CAD5985434.1 protein of unknown function [Streptomyces sp. KY75]